MTYRAEASAANGHSMHKSGKTASHHMLLPSSSSTLETDSSRPTCNERGDKRVGSFKGRRTIDQLAGRLTWNNDRWSDESSKKSPGLLVLHSPLPPGGSLASGESESLVVHGEALRQAWVRR